MLEYTDVQKRTVYGLVPVGWPLKSVKKLTITPVRILLINITSD